MGRGLFVFGVFWVFLSRFAPSSISCLQWCSPGVGNFFLAAGWNNPPWVRSVGTRTGPHHTASCPCSGIGEHLQPKPSAAECPHFSCPRARSTHGPQVADSCCDRVLLKASSCPIYAKMKRESNSVSPHPCHLFCSQIVLPLDLCRDIA